MSKLCRVAAALAATCAVGSGVAASLPARADTTISFPPVTVTLPPPIVPQATVPPVTMPPVTIPSVTVPPTPGQTTTVPSTTVPARSAATGAATASGPGVASPRTIGPASSSAARPRRVRVSTGAAPVAVPVVSAVRPRLPLRRAVSDSARRFAFPFFLAGLVLAFLVLQHRVGGSDPRLVAAPVDDDLRAFR